MIKRDCLSSNFETTAELLGSCSLSGKAVTEPDHPGSVPQLPWIPQTTAAVALRLLELDSSIFHTPNQKSKTHNATEVENFTVKFFLLPYVMIETNIFFIIKLKRREKGKKDFTLGVLYCISKGEVCIKCGDM